MRFDVTPPALFGLGALVGFMVSTFLMILTEWKFSMKDKLMENKWYIKEQCEKIRDDADFIEELTPNKEINKLLQKIIISAYKIEADALDRDLSDIIKRDVTQLIMK